MDAIEQTNLLLLTLGDALSGADGASADFRLDENNECFITLNERLVLMFCLDDLINSVIVNIPLGPLPADESRIPIMFDLLCGNYSWNLTEGGTLGVDRESGLITLSYLVELPLDPPEQIVDIVDKLTSVAEHWMRQIKEANSNDWQFSLPDRAASQFLVRA